MNKKCPARDTRRKTALSVLLIPIGMVFGVEFGLAIDNLPLGIICGVVFGVALFWLVQKKNARLRNGS